MTPCLRCRKSVPFCRSTGLLMKANVPLKLLDFGEEMRFPWEVKNSNENGCSNVSYNGQTFLKRHVHQNWSTNKLYRKTSVVCPTFHFLRIFHWSPPDRACATSLVWHAIFCEVHSPNRWYLRGNLWDAVRFKLSMQYCHYWWSVVWSKTDFLFSNQRPLHVTSYGHDGN